jgi:WD40 repeat protein
MTLSPPGPVCVSPEHVLQGQRSCARSCAIASTPYATIAVASGEDWVASVWDASAGQPIRLLAGHARNIRQCAISEDGLIAATSGKDGSVRVWNTASGSQVWKLQLDGCGTTEACSLTPDGFTLAAIFSNKRLWKQGKDCWLVVADVKNKKQLHTWHFAPANMFQCIISRDASVVAVSLWTKEHASEVRVIDVSTSCAVRRWDCAGDRKPGIALDSCGTLVLIVDGTRLRVCDVNKAEDPRLLSSQYPYVNCSLSGDGHVAVASDQFRYFHVWDVQGGSLCAVLGGHPMRTRACAISADGRKVITACDDSKLRVWNLQNMSRSQLPDEVASSLKGTCSATLPLESSSAPMHFRSSDGEQTDQLASAASQNSSPLQEYPASRHTSESSLVSSKASISSAPRRLYADYGIASSEELSSYKCGEAGQGSMAPRTDENLITKLDDAPEDAANPQCTKLGTSGSSKRVSSGIYRNYSPLPGLIASPLGTESSSGGLSLAGGKGVPTATQRDTEPVSTIVTELSRSSASQPEYSPRLSHDDEAPTRQMRTLSSDAIEAQLGSREGSSSSSAGLKLIDAVSSEVPRANLEGNEDQMSKDPSQHSEPDQNGANIPGSSVVISHDQVSSSEKKHCRRSSTEESQFSKLRGSITDLKAREPSMRFPSVRQQLEGNPSLSLDDFLSSIYMTPQPGGTVPENSVSSSSATTATHPERRNSAANRKGLSFGAPRSLAVKADHDLDALSAEPLSSRFFEFEVCPQSRDISLVETNNCERDGILGKSDQVTSVKNSFMNAAGSLEGKLSVRQAAKISIRVADQYNAHVKQSATEGERGRAESLYAQHGCTGQGQMVDFQLFMVVTALLTYS